MKIFRLLKKPSKSFSPRVASIIDFVIDVVLTVALVLLVIKPFFFAPFRVQQESMMPNILDGEYTITWKLPYHHLFSWKEYERNDIIIFLPKGHENYLIKRVIGLPGETLRFYQGKIWIKKPNQTIFTELDESFLYEDRNGNTCMATNFCSETEKNKQIDFEIPAKSYFVLGDNRTRSRDSRTCFIGECKNEADHFLTHEEIDGKAILIFAQALNNNEQWWKIWKKISFKSVRLLSDPID
jgi:signal peptidase I